jgi:hypothetical protein
MVRSRSEVRLLSRAQEVKKKRYGIKKETVREVAVRRMQKDQLYHPQIENDGGQVGIGQILQHRTQAYQAQGNEEIVGKRTSLLSESS